MLNSLFGILRADTGRSIPGKEIRSLWVNQRFPSMNIILTGSVAYDYLMKFPGYFRDHLLPDQLDKVSLSFLVESMTRWRGGIAPNIAYTLALLGGTPRLMVTVGEDFEDYRVWLESKGVDTSLARVIPGVFTASFFCNTDLVNAQIASFYPGAMAYAGQLSFKDLEGSPPDLVVISPNDPGAMIHYVSECQELGISYLYDPSQQIVRLEGRDLRKGLEGALALFVNDYEFGLVTKMTGMNTVDILSHVKFMVITCGEKGASIYTREQEHQIPVVHPRCIGDPTGVGDAFRGGFITGFSHGMDWDTCGRMGALAATYCLEQTGPQGHSYTQAEFIDRYRQHFDDQGQLDAMIKK